MKSRPVYGVLALREDRVHHTFVSCAEGAMAVKRVLDENVWSGVRLLILHSQGTGGDSYEGLLDSRSGVPVEKFSVLDEMLSALAMHTDQAPAGAHFYLAGPEVNLWLAYQVLRDRGIARDHVSMELLGSKARRVTCVHCKTMNEGVTTNPYRCHGCAQWLLVRDHFSRLMGAYVGVRIDAEEHGVVPNAEEVFA